jgi:putative OPT family oligopeptide transporter
MSAPAAPIRELTFRAIAIGLVLSVVMAAANVYLGLKAGMTVSASIPAAVVGMLILRGLFRSGTILEANQVQTAASAGESLAAGIIFTVPALIIIGAWTDFDFWTTTLIAFTGGLLGILFMIPMRRVFIVDNTELRYPEGVACAAVLETGDAAHPAARGDAWSVVVGAAIGALFKTATGYLHVFFETLQVAGVAGGRVLYFGGDISPALVGVGYIVRLNVAVLVFLGGTMSWVILIPLLPELDALLVAIGAATGIDGLGAPLAVPPDPVDAAWTIWAEKIRYVGVGAMVVGGIFSIVRVRHGLVRAIVELRKAAGRRASAAAEETSRDLPGAAIVGFSALAILLVGGIYYAFTGDLAITIPTTLIMVVMTFFFVAVASYIVGLVGNSNSPVSGMTITAVLFTGGLLVLFGFSGMDGMLATLGVAAVVCCAACTSGDVCNDLKTGSLVGASPRKQQLMEILGVAAASLVMAPVLTVLHKGYGIGSEQLGAPQAQLFAKLAEAFFGRGELPWGMFSLGVLLGIVIEGVDAVLARKKSRFRAHLMPVAVGMYLPFGLAVPILAGGVMAHIHGRGITDDVALDKAMHRGVLFSSGIIAGESLVGVLIAFLVWQELTVGEALATPALVTFLAALALLAFFFRRTKPAH